MRGIGRFVTALTLILALLLGAAGSSSAHALMADHDTAPTTQHEMPCAPHGDHQASPDPDSGTAQKHQMPMTAACCPAVTAPTRLDVIRTTILRRIAWHPDAAQRLDARSISPDPRPPKILL
ncbi:MAG TPA: hypothetical protein VD978_00925 [Azospirillum sp.]|nr:hypothetical protein [Azospirillum sp.]